MQNARGWLQGIHYFRAIAVLEIIVFHVTLGVQFLDLTVFNFQKGLLVTIVGFTSFGVPLFIFISGVVLYHKYSEGFSLSTFYKKRFSSVLPPYLVWSTLYYFLPLVLLILYPALFLKPTIYISNILSGYVVVLAFGIYHLWFIVLIMQLYLLYPLLARVYNYFTGQKNPIYLLSLLLLVQIVYSSLFLTTGPNVFSVFFLSGIFYFVFGFFIAEHYGTLKQKITRANLKSISLTVVLSTVCYAVILYHIPYVNPAAITVPSLDIWLYQIVGPFYCVLLIIFYLRISLEWGEPDRFFTRYLEKIGEDSFGIYLTHFFFVLAFLVAVNKFGFSYDNLLIYPVSAFLIFILSYLSVQVIYRLPFSAIVIGKPRKKAKIPA
jgi:peptidoglycan/LPS O-acetylase OafA/YrhL